MLCTEYGRPTSGIEVKWTFFLWLWSRHCVDLMRHTVGQMADLAVRYERDPVLVVVTTQFIRAEGNLGASSPDAGMRTTAPGSGRET